MLGVNTDISSGVQPVGDTWRSFGADWFNRENISAEDWLRSEQSADLALERSLIGAQFVGKTVGDVAFGKPDDVRLKTLRIRKDLRAVEVADEGIQIGKPASGIDGVFGILSDFELGLVKIIVAHLIYEFDENFVLCQRTQFLRSAGERGETDTNDSAIGKFLYVHRERAVREIDVFCDFVDVHFFAAV